MLLDKGNYQDTLRKASFDDANGVSLIENDDVKVYLLDEMAKDIAGIYDMDIPSSCDSVCINEEEVFVIEFKNREYKDLTPKDKREIRKKAYQTSELLLNSIFRNQAMEDIVDHTTLFIVFRNMKDREKSFGKIADKLNQLANGDVPKIRCKLGQFKGTFYKNIYTIGKEDFEKIYLPMICGK